MARNANNRSQLLRFDRILNTSLWKQMTWICVVLLLTGAISMGLMYLSGDAWRTCCEQRGVSPWLLPLYLLIDTNAYSNLYLGEKPIQGWLMFVSSLTYLIGLLIFNGIIISVLSNYIDLRRQNYRDGLSRYKASGHYVIMGYDEIIPSVVNHIFRHDADAHILMLSAVEAETIRERLRKSVRREQFDRIIVYYGHRIARDYYQDIYLEKAKEIYVVGKRSLPDHDATNVACVENIYNYLSGFAGKPLPQRVICVFEDLDTFAAFKLADIFEKAKQLGVSFMPYNFYVGWAKQVFVARRYYSSLDGACYNYPSVYGNGIGYKDPRQVHLVFIGISNFAAAFAMEAAQFLHFPNGTGKNPVKTRITFIDSQADTKMVQIRTRNRHVFEVQSCLYSDMTGEKSQSRIIPPTIFRGKDADFLDIEFEFIKGDAYSAEMQATLNLWAEDEKQQLSLFLTEDNQRDNFCLSMNMPDKVYDREVPIFIRQDNADTFVTELRNAHTSGGEISERFYQIHSNGEVEMLHRRQRYANIYPFGMNISSFFSDRTTLLRSQLVNYLYRTADFSELTFRDTALLDADPELMSHAKTEWRQLPMSLRWSSFYAAEIIPCKLASMETMRREGISEDKIQEIMSEVEHNRWNIEKLLMGYRKARPEEDKYTTTDEEKQQLLAQNRKFHFVHHDIRPYDELDDVRKLDSEFTRYISWIIRTVPDKQKPTDV